MSALAGSYESDRPAAAAARWASVRMRRAAGSGIRASGREMRKGYAVSAAIPDDCPTDCGHLGAGGST